MHLCQGKKCFCLEVALFPHKQQLYTQDSLKQVKQLS